MFDQPEVIRIILQVMGFLLISLLFANLWFIRRLVDKIDQMSTIVNSVIPTENAKQQEKLKSLEDSHKELKDEVHKVRSEFQNVGALQVRVGVLEYALKIKNDGLTSS